VIIVADLGEASFRVTFASCGAIAVTSFSSKLCSSIGYRVLIVDLIGNASE
jgi:hypothetical protein